MNLDKLVELELSPHEGMWRLAIAAVRTHDVFEDFSVKYIKALQDEFDKASYSWRLKGDTMIAYLERQIIVRSMFVEYRKIFDRNIIHVTKLDNAITLTMSIVNEELAIYTILKQVCYDTERYD